MASAWITRPDIRHDLFPFTGRQVTGIATLTRIRHLMRIQSRLLKDVCVEDVTYSHLWIVPSPYLLTQLQAGERFRFTALVTDYIRKDGSLDAGLCMVEKLGGRGENAQN